MIDYSKNNEILQLLSQVWMIYRKNFPNSNKHDDVLRLIQELQLIIFAE